MDNEIEHCKDCCCARAWKALGITEYTGKSISEHIEELVQLLREHQSKQAEGVDDEYQKYLHLKDDYQILQTHSRHQAEENDKLKRELVQVRLELAREKKALTQGDGG